jgi:hypothetical protein
MAHPPGGKKEEETNEASRVRHGHDISAIRKEVGRLYGIVKDLEKAAD